MKTVLAAGVFDFFHPGHRFFLTKARKLGNRLIVVIARDNNVQRIKNLVPEHNERERMWQVQVSGLADEVRLGNEGGDFLQVIHEEKPHVLAVGYDQRIPDSFGEVFPDIEIVQIEAKNPEEWKSSKYRK